MNTTIYASPLGPLTLLSDETALLGIWFADQQHFGGSFKLETAPAAETPLLKHVKTWLDAYFAGQNPAASEIPVRLSGTPFQKAVLQVLQTIPYGQTLTYVEIAQLVGQKLGRPTSARAVGNAVGRNPLTLIVPCHRVVGKSGSLTGYAGGLTRKIALLQLEGVAINVPRLALK